jgi:hypothetical protein
VSNRLPLLATMVVLAFVSWPSLHSDAAGPLLEDQNIYEDYRVIGDRVLLKNPNASAPLVPSLCKGQDGPGTTWWDDEVRLTHYDTVDVIHPRIVVRANYLHVAWRHDGPGMQSKVYYKRSCDLGHTWYEDVEISSAPKDIHHSSPDISLSSNCLHAVWDYYRKPIWEQGHVYYRRSLDNGGTWEDVYFLSSYDHQSYPSIATLGDTVYVVFARYIDTRDIYEMHFRKSCDEGATWTEDRVITDYGPSLIRGTLCANEEGLHYVFNHDDNFEDPNNPYASKEVFYIHSPDFGDTWTDPIIVSDRDSIHSQWPSMCVDDEGTVHVTWFDYKYSPYSWTGDILHTKSTDKSTDDGRFWSDTQVLTDFHLSRWSNIIARGNHLYLVFEDERHGSHNNEVYFRHSPNRGDSWEAEERLTDASKESYTPVIAEQHDTLYVVWEDHRNDPTNRRSELYFKIGGLKAVSFFRPGRSECAPSLSLCPNPFNSRTTIRFGTARSQGDQRASLKIYSIRGRLVKVLLDRQLVAGNYHVSWDATDAKDKRICSGLYLCVLQVGESRSVAPLLFLK